MNEHTKIAPPWKKPRPKNEPRKKLSHEEKVRARERAEEHGRPYPNLIDNMWVIKQRNQH